MQLYLVRVTEPGESTSEPRPLVGAGLRVTGGFVLPVLCILHGLISVFAGQFFLPVGRGLFVVGAGAAAMGLALACFGVLLHLHLYWDMRYDSTVACARAKIICMVIMGLCAYYLCFSMIV